MKKILSVIFLVTMSLVIFVGCGSKNEEAKEAQTTYFMESQGLTVEMTYYHTGDKVTKQTSVNTFPYESIGIESKEEAEEKLASTVEQYQGVKGLEHSIDYQDTQVVEVLTIDYKEVDLDEISKIPGMQDSGKAGGTISLEQISKQLEKQGYKKK